MYTYTKNGKKYSWNAGGANSNYLDKFDDLDSISLAFYRSWAWAFRGMVSKTFDKIAGIFDFSAHLDY